MDYRSIYISLPDGPQLHLREWGASHNRGREKSVCLLIHGFAEGSFVWRDIGAHLTPVYRVLAIDLRGHGDSGWDAECVYDVESHMSDVIRAVDILGVNRFVVVGHSLGAEIAIRIAAAYPPRLSGAVIVDYGPGINPEGSAQVLADLKGSTRTYCSVAEYASWLSARRPLASAERLTHLAQEALRPCVDGFRLKADPTLGSSRRNGLATDDRAVLWKLLERVQCPALVVRGAMSSILGRESAERMVRLVPSAQLVEVRVAGHAVMTDNPDGFLAAIGPFLAKLAAMEDTPQLGAV